MGDTHSQREQRERERSERAGAHQNRVKFHWNVWNALIISLLSQYGRPSLCALALSHLLLFPLLLMLMMVVYFMRAAAKGQTQFNDNRGANN